MKDMVNGVLSSVLIIGVVFASIKTKKIKSAVSTSA